ncbi:MAG: DUF1573 domain-containing protein [Flavobacteriales bacterium]|nr:DUF1573 domain-containing protein [Flavobacteriales bacterium]
MRFIAALLFVASTFSVSIAQNTGAVIKFEKELHDYGTIEQGADGGTEFVFTNSGKEPLVISDAKGSCGCTVPEWSKEPIAPGQKGSIKVMYDTKRIGNFQKTVTVTSNGSEAPVVLTIKGLVNEVASQGNEGHDHSDPNHKH